MPNTWDSSRQAYIDGLGHQWDSATGTWGPMSAPLPGSGGSSGGSGSTGVGQVSIGNQNRLDQAYIDSLAAAAQLARDQLTATSAYQTGQLGISQQQLGLSQQQLANQRATDAENAQYHLAQLGLTREQIDKQYQIDTQRLGIERANEIRQEKQDAAANVLALANFNLNRDTLNAGIADKKSAASIDALKWLADRSGPQDWTRQNYIENGMDGPTPTGTLTFSPLDIINQNYKPVTTAAPDLQAAMAGVGNGLLSSVAQPAAAAPSAPATTYSQPSASPGGAMQASGGGERSLVANQQNLTPAQWSATQQRAAAMQTAGGGNGLLSGVSGQLSQTPAGSGYGVTPPDGYQIMPDGTVRAAPARTIRALAGGGTTGGAAIVGDRPGQSMKEIKADPHTEIVYSSINPDTGKAELEVLPHERLAGLLDQAMGRKGGAMHSVAKMPAALVAMLPRAYGGYSSWTNGGYNRQPDGAGMGTSATPGQLAQNVNGRVGPVPISGMPGQGGNYSMQTPQGQAGSVWQLPGEGFVTNQAGPDSGGPDSVRAQPGQLPGPMTAPAAGYPVGGGLPGGTPIPESAPGQMVNQAGSGAGTAGGLLSGIPGVDGLNNTGAPAANFDNPGQYDPYRIRVNKYSGDTMNNAPILRKLRGTMGTIGFQGYGKDGNYMGAIPSQGITNLPVQLNMRTLLGLNPGELKAGQAAYDNPESGLSWANIVSMAQAAAPKVGNFGLARAR